MLVYSLTHRTNHSNIVMDKRARQQLFLLTFNYVNGLVTSPELNDTVSQTHLGSVEQAVQRHSHVNCSKPDHT